MMWLVGLIVLLLIVYNKQFRDFSFSAVSVVLTIVAIYYLSDSMIDKKTSIKLSGAEFEVKNVDLSYNYIEFIADDSNRPDPFAHFVLTKQGMALIS